MAGRVERIEASAVVPMFEYMSPAQREIISTAASNSRPLWAGYWDDEPLCVFGLIPPTMLSTTAYLWLATTPAAAQHKLIFGRWARRMVAEMLIAYPCLVGHCVGGVGEQWMRSLGATLTPRDANITAFEITR